MNTVAHHVGPSRQRLRRRRIDAPGGRWLVTGAARGLGFELARLAEEELGAEVICVDRTAPARTGHRRHLTVDLATRSGTDQVRQLIRVWRPTVLVNNAALLQSRHVTETPDAMVDDLVAVGLTTPFLLMREMATVHARTDEDTWVVNVVSPYRLIGVRTHSLYCATKAALSRTGESLGVELPSTGSLTVVSVVPGAFNSQLRPVEPHDAWLVRTYRGFHTRTPATVAVSLMNRLRRGTRRKHWTLRLGWDGRAFEVVTRIGAGDLSLPVLDALIGQRTPADRRDRAGAENDEERDGDVPEMRLREGEDQREAHQQR